MTDITSTAGDEVVEAAPAPVLRMIGPSGGLCLDDTCSIEQFIEADPQ